MRKHVIYAELSENGESSPLVFYYRRDGGAEYLFSCRYQKSVYDYFKDGKSPEQLKRNKDWRKNTRLTHLVEGSLRRHMS